MLDFFFFSETCMHAEVWVKNPMKVQGSATLRSFWIFYGMIHGKIYYSKWKASCCALPHKSLKKELPWVSLGIEENYHHFYVGYSDYLPGDSKGCHFLREPQEKKICQLDQNPWKQPSNGPYDSWSSCAQSICGRRHGIKLVSSLNRRIIIQVSKVL